MASKRQYLIYASYTRNSTCVATSDGPVLSDAELAVSALFHLQPFFRLTTEHKNWEQKENIWISMKWNEIGMKLIIYIN